MAKNIKKQEQLRSLTDSIQFENIDITFVLRNKTLLREWVALCIKKEKKQLGYLSFNFCSDRHLLNMNKEHLNHDYYTDIITFELNEHGLISGDIYISIDRVKDNAKTIGNPFNQELWRVIIHGVLHLCGYKDKSDKDAKNMRKKEDHYLSLLP